MCRVLEMKGSQSTIVLCSVRSFIECLSYRITFLLSFACYTSSDRKYKDTKRRCKERDKEIVLKRVWYTPLFVTVTFFWANGVEGIPGAKYVRGASTDYASQGKYNPKCLGLTIVTVSKLLHFMIYVFLTTKGSHENIWTLKYTKDCKMGLIQYNFCTFSFPDPTTRF